LRGRRLDHAPRTDVFKEIFDEEKRVFTLTIIKI
jgi:hypothetical protein